MNLLRTFARGACRGVRAINGQRQTEASISALRTEAAAVRSDLAAVQSDLAGLRAEMAAARPPACPPVGHADLDELASRAVFVVGAARSGTTILAAAVNQAPDALILHEAFLYGNCHNPEFAEQFNRIHLAVNRTRRMKGTYIPPAREPEPTAFHTFRRLAARYRVVGEKLAFGGGPGSHPRQYDLFFRFHAEHFFPSKYLFVIRRPEDAVRSMEWLWPTTPWRPLLATWLKTVQTTLDMYLTFPDCRLVFFDDLTPDTMDVVFNWLGSRATLTAGFFKSELQKHARAGRAADPARAAAVEAAESVRLRLRAAFDPLTLQASDPALFYPAGRDSLSHALQCEIEAQLARLVDPSAAHPGPVAIPA